MTECVPELVKRDAAGFKRVKEVMADGWRIVAAIPWTSTQNLIVWEREKPA